MASTLLRTLHRPPRIHTLTTTSCSSRTPFRFVVALTGARRRLQTSPSPNAALTAEHPPAPAPSPTITTDTTTHANADNEAKSYYGPLAQTFRRLKMFSLGSLALSAALTPCIFVLETASAVPLVGRCALAATVLATSGLSTALVAWTGRPYVHTLAWLPQDADTSSSSSAQSQGQDGSGGRQVEKAPTGIELRTLTFALHEQTTRVYDTAFLVRTARPFATWELASTARMPAAEAAAERLPREETVAEELDYFGKVGGRWVVRWDADGAGTCYAQGKIFRYFNVHEELLDRPLR